MKKLVRFTAILTCVFAFSACAVAQPEKTTNAQEQQRIVPFGTTINPKVQIQESQKLAKSLATPDSTKWRAKGDQKRTYRFAEAGGDMPYRVCVPSKWDGKSKLPLVMFLHGAWNDESSYLDADEKLMVKLADEHGYLLVSPLGYTKLGAYGTCILLPAVFGKPEEVTKMISNQKAERWQSLELSEKDVINVLELVLNEYPVDRSSMFLMGHSMGSGGTWYIGAKYADYWKALAPMSGPFVDEKLYPWDRIRKMSVFVSEGSRSAGASVESSRLLGKWMKEKGFKVDYKEVDADHPGMVPLILPDVFNFFDRCRAGK